LIKKNGEIFFRDYGICDEAQLRLALKQKEKLGENRFVKGDGTTVTYFRAGRK
jgi:hypothetical protein